MEISAVANTWSNSRKKRRQAKHKQIDQKDNNGTNLCNVNKINVENSDNHKEDLNLEVVNNKDLTNTATKSEDEVQPELKMYSQASEQDSLKRLRNEDMESANIRPSKILKSEIPCADPFMYGSLILRRRGDCTDVELCWLRGVGGRDAAHQILQYFKNNLETH